MAPKGTPQVVLNRLHEGLVRAMGTAEMKARLTKLAAEGMATAPAEFASLIREEHAKWGKVIKAAGLQMK